MNVFYRKYRPQEFRDVIGQDHVVRVLEGAVKLGFRKELEAVSDLQQRDELFRTMVADMYERGKAVNNATFFEFDDVIDPAQSRQWIMTALRSAPAPAKRKGKKRPCIDTW